MMLLVLMVNLNWCSMAQNKIKNWRWTCHHCKSEGWQVISKQGEIPQHDRPDGRNCKKFYKSKLDKLARNS